LRVCNSQFKVWPQLYLQQFCLASAEWEKQKFLNAWSIDFFEQNPRNPMAVCPVYYSFPDGPLDTNEFAKQYIENFIRYYIGFFTSQPKIIINELEGKRLLEVVTNTIRLFPFTDIYDTILMWYYAIVRRKEPLCHALALEVPRKVSDIDDTSIAVFIAPISNYKCDSTFWFCIFI